MKEGEEEKTKTYSALIWTEKVIWSKDIAFLDNMQVMYHVFTGFIAYKESASLMSFILYQL